ncbi:dharma [Brachyhypopomus gauderio]|uniref:dharma n=1 Tax=Brachyhypopomus gauderio TaxID=698409 RepID=UPI0040434F90
MDELKFSNFTIDYILGETTRNRTPAMNFPTPPESLSGHFNTLNLAPLNGLNGQASADAMMSFQAHCQGLYDRASCYNTPHCCAPVTYYQTNLNMSCCSEQCFYAFPDCNKENCGFRTTQQRQRNRIRTVFTESQTKQLDQLFGITDYPSAEARAEVAKNTGLSEETVRVWFKNRRARRKRQKGTSAAVGPYSS